MSRTPRNVTRVAGLWFLGLCVGGGIAEAQRVSAAAIESLPGFMDATVARLMKQGHVPGTAVAIVHDGRVVFLKGYGQARLDSGDRVDASRTLFRVGSVSKSVTAVAVMQLVDAGKLDLHRDIRTYLPDVPLRYGATAHQLLTHTAGLDERFVGAYTNSPEHLVPLAPHIRLALPRQVRRPGTAYSYANYHFALLGLLVERLSGSTFEQYVADRVFAPIGMRYSTARQPPEPALADNLAASYRWENGRQEAVPYRYTFAGPSGGISTTAADMGRFILALLGDGSADGGRILSPAARALLLAEQFTPDARIPGTAYGFHHWLTHGLRLLHKDGTLGDQIGVLVLAPDERLGVFVASNAVPGVANQVLDPLLTHLVGPSSPVPPPTALPDAPRRAPRFAGAYRDYHHTRNDMTRLVALMPVIQSRVAAASDGSLNWRGRRWVEVAPSVFRRADSLDHIVFREDEQGNVAELHAWGATYERIGWLEQPPLHLAFLASCLVAFLAYPLSRGIRALRRRSPATEGRAGIRCAVFVALANCAFLAGLLMRLRDPGATVPLSLPVVLWLSLPLVSLAGTVFVVAVAAAAWRSRWWTRAERLGFTTVAALAAAFPAFLHYWKLLGYRY